VSQGVTTVIVGNCGISAAPLARRDALPEPLNLLGRAGEFSFPTFAEYVEAVGTAGPATNVAALVGHTSLRSNELADLAHPARAEEIAGMRAGVDEALAGGALGLSTGLAYANARAATTDEVAALAAPLSDAGGLYCTHLRTEAAGIVDALHEAFDVGRRAGVPVMVSHLKCAGVENHGRSGEILDLMERAGETQPLGWDCYPYSASSTTLDLGQVTPDYDIVLTWSDPYPEMEGRRLADIAATWGTDLATAARRLQPAGAVYHCMAPDDVDAFLRHPGTAIGSDGLPGDRHPHPRLWGTFARVLGHYARERRLLPLADAVRRMTGLPADRFRLAGRGYVREGAWADLVLFDPARVRDTATYEDPCRRSEGIMAVFVNGVLTWHDGAATGRRAGRFLPREPGQEEGR
jgi:N-acyl-D-amino-acid deacylase